MNNNIHFVGIGGIGMSALAQMLKARGIAVSGSDREESPTTELLRSKGVTVFIGQSAENLKDGVELIVYSDAVPIDNPERAEAARRNIAQKSYFQMLGDVSKDMRTIAVAGTHGKTTTTGMLAKILVDAGINPHAIIGSIVRDFGSNYVQGESDWLVVEACEYRNHLLELSPEVLVITNVELDHTDFFPDIETLIATFNKAVRAVPEQGVIVACVGGEYMRAVLAGARARVVDYAGVTVPELKLIGEFNKENARAAKAVAHTVFTALEQSLVDASLQSFQGSWRRFEYKGKNQNGADVYDDYAHHPTAVGKTIEGARQRFPDKKIVVAFHPHLFSRTKSFLKEFAQALSIADEIFVAPIYAAREKDDGSVSNERLAQEIQAHNPGAQAGSFVEIAHALANYGNDTLIITMGAGDIYKVAEQIAR